MWTKHNVYCFEPKFPKLNKHMKTDNTCTLSIQNTELNLCKSVKFLGTWIDNLLNWNHQTPNSNIQNPEKQNTITGQSKIPTNTYKDTGILCPYIQPYHLLHKNLGQYDNKDPNKSYTS